MLSSIGSQAISFAALSFLAHVVLPSQFGLAATVIAVTGLGQILGDLGLGSAVIFLTPLRKSDIATGFWLGVAVGLLLYGLIWILSVPIAALIGNSALVGLLRLGGLIFALSNYTVPFAVLERAFKFRTVAGIELITTLFGVLIAVAVALGGAGAAGLVLGPVITGAAKTLVGILFVTKIPSPRNVDRAAFRRLRKQSAGVAGFNVVNYASRNVDTIALAAARSAVEVGYYSRAYAVMMAPILQVTLALGRVMFPTLARLRETPAQMSASYRRAIRATSFVLFPLVGAIAAMSHDVIEVFFGSRWTPAVPLLALLAASAPPQLLAGTTGAVYQASGRSGLLFKRGTVLSTCTVVAVFAGLHWGAVGVATALLIRMYLLLPYTMSLPLRLLGLNLRSLASDISKISVGTLLACAVYAAGAHFLVLPAFVRLVVVGIAGAATYCLVMLLLEPALAGVMIGRLKSIRLRQPSSSSAPVMDSGSVS